MASSDTVGIEILEHLGIDITGLTRAVIYLEANKDVFITAHYQKQDGKKGFAKSRREFEINEIKIEANDD